MFSTGWIGPRTIDCFASNHNTQLQRFQSTLESRLRSSGYVYSLRCEEVGGSPLSIRCVELFNMQESVELKVPCLFLSGKQHHFGLYSVQMGVT